MILKLKYIIFGFLSIIILCCFIKYKENFEANSFKGRPFTYMGLFTDKKPRDLPNKVGNVNEKNTFSDAAKCHVMCKDYKYFGLQYFGECWCGNSYGKHGEKKENGKKAKFTSNDTEKLILQPTEVIVLSNDHESGRTGQYFNYDIDTLDKVFGIKVGKSKAGDRAKVMRGNTIIAENVQLQLWSSVNGGSKGNGHGRLRYNAAPGQWKVGDKIIPLWPKNRVYDLIDKGVVTSDKKLLLQECKAAAKQFGYPFLGGDNYKNGNMVNGCQTWQGKEVYYNNIGTDNCDRRPGLGVCITKGSKNKKIKRQYGGWQNYVFENHSYRKN